MESVGLQAGVYEANDFKVTPAGGTYQLNIAAGRAWVQATGTRMGRYLVVNDASETLTIAAAHATNPRIDQIVLRVRDAADLGDVTNVPELSVIQGTATSGATLANRTGAASLPSNSLRLADILVPSTGSGFAGTFVQNTHLRDRRPWARGGYASSVQTSGADYTTTSTSYVSLDDTNVFLRMECVGNPIVMALKGHLANNTAGAATTIRFQMDGASAEGTEGIAATSSTASAAIPFSVQKVVVPSAGSHSFSIAWKASSGTATIQRGTDFYVEFTVEEIFKANTSNSGA